MRSSLCKANQPGDAYWAVRVPWAGWLTGGRDAPKKGDETALAGYVFCLTRDRSTGMRMLIITFLLIYIKKDLHFHNAGLSASRDP
jgi:hypothetical protein